MNGLSLLLVRALAIGLALFHIYTAYVGTFLPYVQRSVPLLVAAVLALLTVSLTRTERLSGNEGDTAGKVPLYDWLLVLAALPAFGYVLVNSGYLAERWPMTSTYAMKDHEIALGILAVVVLLEVTRRVMGWLLVIVAACALGYAYFGEYIPIPDLTHRGFRFEHVLDYMYMTDNGIWGVALGVAAAYIVLFVIFGAFAERAGAAEFFIQFANGIAGHTRGGPAKVAVFSSGLIGSVTGSSVANVYTTGQFTIPLMKKLGYRPSIAGAIEALASNGGQIMPPILGAAAFIVAANTGVPYAKVALASLIPAVLYFGGLFWFIHLEAHKSGLRGISREERPDPVKTLLRGGHLLSPILVLIGCLWYGFSPTRAAFYAIVFTVLVSWVRKETRLGPRKIVEALERGARGAVLIIITCAVVGFVIGVFTLTGVGLNISSAIISWSGGSFFVTLVLIGVSCMVLGMGMNTVAAFILVSVIGVPALIQLGVEPLIANMFVFYFALLSHITPPVCLAIFAGAHIAGANIWETSLMGVKMGAVAYLLPFLVVYSPGLLLVGDAGAIAISFASVAAGLGMLVCAIQGWLRHRLALWQRALLLAAGLALIWSDPMVKAAGLVVGVVVLALLVSSGRQPARPYQGGSP